jgi:hypothetical protein
MAKKNKRKQKVSHGERKSSYGVELNNLQKVLLGKGMMENAHNLLNNNGKPIRPWYGAGRIEEPFDAEQAKLNRKLYPHLFGGN